MIGLLLLLALAVWRYRETGLPSAFTTDFPSDLKVYVLGGEQVSAGQPLYAGDLLPGLPFTYPPFAGVVFSWLTESEALGVAWKAASVLVLWLVVRASTARHALLLTAVFVLWLSPVQGTLYFGQINLLLMGLVCLDFLPRVRLPGIGVGLAAGLKLTPAFFVLLLVQQRRWGAVCIAAFTFLCTVATGFAEVVDAKHFWADAIFSTGRVGADDNPGAQSIRQVLARADADSTALWLLVAAAVTALALLASRRAPAPLAVSIHRHDGLPGQPVFVVPPLGVGRAHVGLGVHPLGADCIGAVHGPVRGDQHLVRTRPGAGSAVYPRPSRLYALVRATPFAFEALACTSSATWSSASMVSS